MSLYLVVPALFLVAVLQASAVPHLTLWGVFPDLPLVIVVSWGLLSGSRGALVWGVIAGLFLDLFSGTPAGAAPVALGIAGAVAGLARRSALRAPLLLPAGMTVVSTLVYNGVLLVALWVAGRTVPWLESLSRVALPSVVLNLLLLPLVYYPLRALHRRTVGRETDL